MKPATAIQRSECPAALSVPQSLATQALEAIRGGTEAQKLVYRLRHEIVGTDELLQALQATLATGSYAHCSGFCRELQKRLEASR